MSKSAAGTEGFLLIYPDTEGNEIIVFRVYEYDENGKHKRNEKGGTIYKDYQIRHHDLKIKLLDGHFVETEKGDFIDYPER